MKKKLTLSLCLLCTLLIFSACSKESRGVPESVILQDTGDRVERCNSYKIKHDVDTSSHIDDVEIELYYEGNYGTNVVTIPYSYQYDKSSDTWTLIQEHDKTQKYLIDEKSYINSSPWTGSEPYPDNCNYSITFHELDMKSCTATITYKIDFDDNQIADISNRATIKIYNMYGSSYAPFFIIEYETHSIWSDKEGLQFFLTIDGLVPISEYL